MLYLGVLQESRDIFVCYEKSCYRLSLFSSISCYVCFMLDTLISLLCLFYSVRFVLLLYALSKATYS